MKKRILAIIVVLLVLLTLTIGCNYKVVDLNYDFKNAYVKIGEEWHDLELKSWRDYEDGEQIQLVLLDGTVLIVHSANCVLYNGELPTGEDK